MKLMIFDGNSVVWSAGYSTSYLSYRNAQTGVIFGTLKFMLSIFSRFDVTTTAIVWDSYKTLRRQIYPDYKVARRQLKDEDRAFKEFMIKQIHNVQNFLAKIHYVNSFSEEGYEGDDLVASLVKQYKDKAEEVYIVSSDSDLYQLLSDNVFQIRPRKSEQAYGKKDFMTEYGIDPSKWIMVKAIAGDTSDSIPGIKGVGINRAIKYLNGELKETSKFYQKIQESDDIIKRNLELVTLPLRGTPELKISRSKSSLDEYISYLDSKGMKSLLKKENLTIAKKAFRLF